MIERLKCFWRFWTCCAWNARQLVNNRLYYCPRCGTLFLVD